MSSCPLSTPNPASLSLLETHPRPKANPLALTDATDTYLSGHPESFRSLCWVRCYYPALLRNREAKDANQAGPG